MEMKNPRPMMTEKMPTTKPPTRSSAVSRVSSQGASALNHERSITQQFGFGRSKRPTLTADRSADKCNEIPRSNERQIEDINERSIGHYRRRALTSSGSGPISTGRPPQMKSPAWGRGAYLNGAGGDWGASAPWVNAISHRECARPIIEDYQNAG